jgi:hypothetical protein
MIARAGQPSCAVLARLVATLTGLALAPQLLGDAHLAGQHIQRPDLARGAGRPVVDGHIPTFSGSAQAVSGSSELSVRARRLEV